MSDMAALTGCDPLYSGPDGPVPCELWALRRDVLNDESTGDLAGSSSA